jgi:peptide-methionine (S)-S-oxide reductase
MASTQLQTATFGGGCFWCTEAVFQQLAGVHSVVSGYAGGRQASPTYEQVCTGTTGHAEVIQVTFDPQAISYADLLEAFFHTHDPTTLNRQGNDAGTQYRSVIFYHDDEQRRTAEEVKVRLDKAGDFDDRLYVLEGDFDDRIVTEIAPFTAFYPAEGYHQNYYQDNPGQGYCRVIIGPKMAKFRQQFAEKLKPT